MIDKLLTFLPFPPLSYEISALTRSALHVLMVAEELERRETEKNSRLARAHEAFVAACDTFKEGSGVAP